MFECSTCTASFYYREDCDEHMDEERHWIECQTCNRQFCNRHACNQHMDALNHWAPNYECESCTRKFFTQSAVNQHMNALNHWAPTIECETCTMKFHTQRAANDHMEIQGHYKNYCSDCDRHFRNENCLRQHLNSKTHRGTNVACPFCRTGFVTATGVAHHLERGACPRAPMLNRDKIHRIIQQLDPTGIVCNKQIAWYDEEDVHYTATPHAFNGGFWVCYICKKCFNMKKSLESHLNSPVHKEKIYHCLNRGCPKEFVSLASLFNHLESESCGFIRFEGVQRIQRQLNDAIMGHKMITGF
ncbi:Zinc fingerC2H2 [Penicillium sp. IBT 31633x]|nr:Zinc fingerC2H2 [Penicillium sp. IBT 31633x]